MNQETGRRLAVERTQEKSAENLESRRNQKKVWNPGNQELGELFCFPGFVVSRFIFLCPSPVLLLSN
jgi:hypothetical protein